MTEIKTLRIFLVSYAAVAYGMYHAGRWRRRWPGWSWTQINRYKKQVDVERVRVQCLEADLEEMETQRDQLAGYADQLEARTAIKSNPESVQGI